MSDEIKEILNEIKILNGNVALGYEKSQLLLDYITNLQTIEQQYSAILSENAELENKITNLQEENERLNNIINELEKWLKDVDVFQMNFIENKDHITPYKAVLDKLKELKENNEEIEELLTSK